MTSCVYCDHEDKNQIKIADKKKQQLLDNHT